MKDVLEGGDVVEVWWRGIRYEATYLDLYIDCDLPGAIVVTIPDDVPGLRWNDDLVCIPNGERWRGVFPV